MLLEIERELTQAALDPVAFFGLDPEATYRVYAVRLHPDRFAEQERDEAARLFRLLGSLKADCDRPREVIASPTRQYTVQSSLGRGDLCDVLYVTCDSESFVLKRPYVQLPAANNLLAKERESLEQLQDAADGHTYAHYLPVPVESFTVGNIRLNAFRWKAGLYASQAVLDRHTRLEGRHIAWMFKRLLTVIGFVHQHEWAHCAVLPQHCLWSTANHGLVLCDWIHATPLGKSIAVVPGSHKAWYPDGKTATPALDIYLAAKTVTHLAGGEEQLPPLMRGFLRSCYLPGRMAPDDAWKLCAEFTDMLDQLYGPPVFVPLEMR